MLHEREANGVSPGIGGAFEDGGIASTGRSREVVRAVAEVVKRLAVEAEASRPHRQIDR